MPTPQRQLGRSTAVINQQKSGIVVVTIDGRQVSKSLEEVLGLFGLPESFPVGSVFSAAVLTPPAVMLGYGTWELFAVGTATNHGDPLVVTFQ